jgi:hypothetical protein
MDRYRPHMRRLEVCVHVCVSACMCVRSVGCELWVRCACTISGLLQLQLAHIGLFCLYSTYIDLVCPYSRYLLQKRPVFGEETCDRGKKEPAPASSCACARLQTLTRHWLLSTSSLSLSLLHLSPCVSPHTSSSPPPSLPLPLPLPDRALCLPTFSHFLIVNKTSLIEWGYRTVMLGHECPAAVSP